MNDKTISKVMAFLGRRGGLKKSEAKRAALARAREAKARKAAERRMSSAPGLVVLTPAGPVVRLDGTESA